MAPSVEHVGNLERFGLQADNIETPESLIHRGQGELCTVRIMYLGEVPYMATTKVERAGVGFSIGRQRPIILEVHTHHDIISAVRGVQIGFELLNGITLEQAKKIVDVLNENVIGLLVTTASDDKTEAASG